jgi:hypothetical protein
VPIETYPESPKTSEPNVGYGHSCRAMTSGGDVDENRGAAPEEEEEEEEEERGGRGRRRHSSRMRLGADRERRAGSGAEDDGWALDTFHERRVRRMLAAGGM